jgi:hypothetical protein
MPNDHDDVAFIHVWKLALGKRKLTPREWKRWYFIQVVVYAMLTIIAAAVFTLSTAKAGVNEPQSIFDVSGYMYQLLSPLSGIFALWTALMLTISALGLFAARRAMRRSTPVSDFDHDTTPTS